MKRSDRDGRLSWSSRRLAILVPGRGWNSPNQLPRFQQVCRSNQFVEMVAESNPSEAARLCALSFPAFRVYRRGPKGLELACVMV